MQPFVAAAAVREDYRHYIETSFLVRDPALKARIGQLIEDEKLLWQEAFVSLARPFRSGGSLSDLVAEGVETNQQLETLTHLGLRVFQGYLFAAGLSADDFAALLREPDGLINSRGGPQAA